MKSNFIGAIIAISAAIGSNLGVNVQKRSHTFEELRPKDKQRPYTRRPLWWLGMFLIIFGSLGDFFALGFAPQTLVASLGGGSTIIANIFFAKFWLKQRLFYTDILGVILVTIGVVILAAASTKEGKYTIGEIYVLMQAPQFIIYAMITSCFIASLYVRVKNSTAPSLTSVNNEVHSINDNSSVSASTDSNPKLSLNSGKSSNDELSSLTDIDIDCIHNENDSSNDSDTLVIDPNLPLYWAAISGTVGAQSVLLAKCVMEMIFESISGENQFIYIGTYFLVLGMIGTLLTQTYALNMATMNGDTMSSFPVFQAFWIGMSNISGIIFFQQVHTFNIAQWIMFPTAMILVMFGIYLISKHEKMSDDLIKYTVAMPFTFNNSTPYNHCLGYSFQFTELSIQEPNNSQLLHKNSTRTLDKISSTQHSDTELEDDLDN